jgi:hypothetical protein
MDDSEEDILSAEDSISDEISERVRSVLAAAESAATAIRHEAEQQIQIKKRAAETERLRLLDDARSEAEALLHERIKRISELSDSLIEGAEKILMRMEGAQEVKRQLETMVHALADAAEELAAESSGVASTASQAAPRVRAVPDPDPTVTEAEAPAAARGDGPAEPADLEPVEVVPDEDVEVVDAVEVVDEPEPSPERRSPVERLRKVASAGRPDNGGVEEKKPEPASGFDGDDMLAARLVALQMAVAGSERGEVEAHLRQTFSLDEPGAILNDVFGTESKL